MKTLSFNELTLTVGELRELLTHYPADMPVLATWEGIYTCVRGKDYRDPWNGETSDFVRVEVPPNGAYYSLHEPCLVLDVDQ